MDWCTRLEIGAGGGLVGLAVANGCSLSQPLHITDQLEMLTLMGHNVLLNNAQGRVKPMVLNWCVQTYLVDHHSHPHIVDRYPRLSCLSATLATCSVTSSCPTVSRPSVANLDNKIQQGRATAVGNDRVQAGCDPGCRLCLLRARLPAAAADPQGPSGALSLRHGLLLFHEETARGHAVPENRQKVLCRDRDR